MNELDAKLMAYFDGELDPDERVEFERQLADDPVLRQQLASLDTTRALVVGEAQREADDVPAARFEQIWDRVEDELYAPPKAGAAPVRPGFLVRLPRLWPTMMAAAAAAVIALVVWPRDGFDESGTASKPAVAVAPTAAPAPGSSVTPGSAERADDVVLPDPAPTETETESGVDIERIDFAGRSGRIAHIDDARGTTTVIWIEEDPQPVDSERSL